MSWTQTGSCPKCGAPIYAPAAWFGVTPPPPHFTCGCAGGPVSWSSNTTGAAGFAPTIHSTNTDSGPQPVWAEPPPRGVTTD